MTLSLNRQLLNDLSAAVGHAMPPVCTRLEPDQRVATVVTATDAKFLRLIDDLVEMHPAGCGHRRGPLRAGPRGYGFPSIDVFKERYVV